jgi:hypothetical protein
MWRTTGKIHEIMDGVKQKNVHWRDLEQIRETKLGTIHARQ